MKALIIGATGQDASYLAEFLLKGGYEVHGLRRRNSTANTDNINHLLDYITLHYGDVTDQYSVIDVIDRVQPDEVYNLAAQSFVTPSWNQPEYTANVNALGPLRLLNAIKVINPKIKFYQSSTSEMYGKVLEIPQNENTPFYPRSPYGVSKLYGHYITINYRESFDLFAVSGILFNHESPRRGIEFVTRKIVNGAIRCMYGVDKELRLGNLDSCRDWGYTGDFVEAMWLMLQNSKPVDYVVGTGKTHSVREFCEITFSKLDMNYKDYVVIDPKLFRPADVEVLLADSSRIRNELGWSPKVDFNSLIDIMIEGELFRWHSQKEYPKRI